ncbi:Transposase IS4 [Popillia japonica]|uniref:Transposase IS4 n=1 Tax=Popillia japonica TaxID=7064 RepID=A0AAW1MAW9_POPJA
MQNLHCSDNTKLNPADKFSKVRPLFEIKKRFIELAPNEEHHSVDESMVPYFGRHGTKQFIKGKPISDNTKLNPADKFSKVRPLFEIKKRFIELAPNEEHHSVDESMVPYFGRHGTKQFIKGKPIRWGYKFWCGTTCLGYIERCIPGFFHYNFPSAQKLRSSVVLQFAEVLQKKTSNNPYDLYFDNFFTSIKLLHQLKCMGMKGTGTIRENRVGEGCKLPHSSILKKQQRGAYLTFWERRWPAYSKMKKQKGGRWYQAALNAQPDHVPAHITYGKLLAKNVSRIAEAEQWFRKAQKLAPDDATVYHHYALCKAKNMACFINSKVKGVKGKLSDSLIPYMLTSPVGIHCRGGRGRTGVMAACYLTRFQEVTPERAIIMIRLMRPGSIETPEQERAVIRYYDCLRGTRPSEIQEIKNGI